MGRRVEVQGDLEQEQLDAAEALVSAGQDLTELECQKDTQSRRLEDRMSSKGLLETSDLIGKGGENVDVASKRSILDVGIQDTSTGFGPIFCPTL